jgi:O-antigen/teichoic acid export membrane protein
MANMAIAAGRIKILIMLAGLLIVSNVGLNLLLIPRWSFNGAAFSTFACELMSAVVLGPTILKTISAPRGQQ